MPLGQKSRKALSHQLRGTGKQGLQMQVPVNALSIYLIKEEFKEHASILKDIDHLDSKAIRGVGVLYYGASQTHKPSWIEKFFKNTLGDVNIFNASAKAVLLVEVNITKSKKRIFAVPFGYGWNMLDSGTWEERFGLKTTLNIVQSDGLRKIDKKNLASVPRDTSEQLSRAGIVSDFGINIEQDLILSITGSTTDNTFGRSVTGKDALNISARVDVESLTDFLKSCYDRYVSNDYRKEFGWIDQIAEIKNPNDRDELDGQLVAKLNSKDLTRVWMAVPELVEWEDVAGFKYRDARAADSFDDIRLSDFLESLSESQRTAITIELLKRKNISCITASNGEVKYNWKAYACFYCELVDSDRGKTFLLSNGKWYEIDADFVKQTNRDFKRIRDAGCSLKLPRFSHKNENEYNIAVAQKDRSMCCMDREDISYGGGYSKIEFCDLHRKDKKIIHVKRYGGSSVLSHLFAQGVVSGELFLADDKFREKVNARLSASHKLKSTSARPNANEYEIIFAIISTSESDLDLPFFSKVTLKNAVRSLLAYGYKVSVLKIPSSEPAKEN